MDLRFHSNLKQKLDFMVQQRLMALLKSVEYEYATRREQRQQRRNALIDVFKKFYKFSFGRIKNLHQNGSNPEFVVLLNTTLIDIIFAKLWEIVSDFNRPMCTRENYLPAIIAVGGYGRGELNPYSDIDLLIVAPREVCPYIELVANRLLYLGWDIGLKVSHSVRSVDECVSYALSDVTIRTAIMEARLICGSELTWQHFHATITKKVLNKSVANFINAKINESKVRHEKQSVSLYQLEPNVKEGIGGLRDIHTCFWIAKAKYPEKTTEDIWKLFAIGDVRKSRDFLWRVRNELHYLCGRPQDVLTFENQQLIANNFGYEDEKARCRLAVEEFMHDYYKNTRRIHAASEIIIARCAPEKLRQQVFGSLLVRELSDGFYQRGNEITAPATPDLFRSDPVRILKVFSIAQRRNLHISPEFKGFIRRNLGIITPQLRSNPSAAHVFRSIMKYNTNVARTLSQMHGCGVLGRYIPEFGTLDCLVQFDRYHYYTTDEHTIRTIAEFETLAAPEHLGSRSLFASALSRLGGREILLFSLLLHDIGKGRGGDHSRKGAEMVPPIAARLGLSFRERNLIEFLVRHHLLMANLSQRRDLSDPKTIEIFCDTVDTREKLDHLYVLSNCDIRAVGPGVWTDWKGSLLDTLYRSATEYIDSGSSDAYQQQSLARLQREVREYSAIDEELFALFDREHLVSYPPAEIHRHVATLRELTQQRERIHITHTTNAATQTTDILVAGYDYPGIFSHIAGAILVKNLGIITCKINTFQNGMILDVITVHYTEAYQADDDAFWHDVKTYVKEVLLGKTALAVSRSWLRMKPITKKNLPAISIHNDQSQKCTVIEVFCNDKPGLLYKLATALYQLSLSIHAANITTKVEQVVDVFYVTDLLGHKVVSEERLQTIKERIYKLL
ncbi:[protein-PII] uridylyltransferase [Chrysiogenes arsenatis]|uniref:[protein-PII] uridylyltransferase n=1 Tax=Chrysiogenes arsenatis TaxID=309797 RepID=UPI00040930F5|nr:[protein-PII] uridylyltransferase [Chrysiogenes arsenatis]